ncbi:hypothetical protein QYE76_035380 [Lolium multiflorum]|uniref:DUF4218 domain-containing protein n=1 Tax=Lolium multiflorum TaxID=4521 RepID=A0AAD8QZX1_LOLMU|nr:hypothetical protein QYE76_035380 [Lolium multiflorum]
MYLELLKEELETLWAEEGVDTWDAVAEEYFPLRAALITTVQDYLGYGYISCQVCHGHKACVRCMEETMFLQLGKDPGSSKTVYMGHRRWLQKTDPWRKRGDLFDGTNEPRGPPRKKSGEEIDTLLKGWKECPAPGKIRQKPGEKKKKKETTPLIGVWKRRSVFWDLPYWKILDTPHCLDVMHITKNVCESLLGTLLNMPDRTKDGPKARQDLKVLGIREELQIPPAQEGQSEEEADGGQKRKRIKQPDYYCPPSCFTFSPAEVDQFFNCLVGVRVPFGYSGLISRYMDPKKRNFSGMKSHDCHVMMTQILPVAIRGIMDDHVRATLTGLCNFFDVITRKSISVKKLARLQEEIVVILCEMEMYFPPAFFDVMVHLLVHIMDDIVSLGPAFLHNMMPFERMNGVIKGYVRNRSHPDGSIVQGWLTEECISFCTNYLDIEDPVGLPQNKHLCRFEGVGHKNGRKELHVHMSGRSSDFDRANLVALQHIDLIDPWLKEHKTMIENSGKPMMTEAEIYREHNSSFARWFKDHIDANPPPMDSDKDKLVLALSHGPAPNIMTYQAYDINGYTFYTEEKDKNSVYQNSGTLIRINTYSGSTASKDKHLAAPHVSVPPRQPAAPVVIAPPERPAAPEVSAPPQQPAAPEAEEYERDNFQWDIPTSSQVVHEDAPGLKYVCSKKLFDSQETAEEENPEEVATAAVKNMLSPNTLRATATTAMEGPSVQPKKRKRQNKKDAQDKAAAAKSKDKVPLLDKLPNNWRPLHHLGQPMLPEHVVKKLTPDMRSLHETVLHVENLLLKSKDPGYPLFVAKVPTGMNFVEKYPADLCFIRFNDIFSIYRMQALHFSVVRLVALSLSSQIVKEGTPTIAIMDPFYMRESIICNPGDRAIATQQVEDFMLANIKKGAILIPYFPEDKFCTLIVVHPQHSHAVYLDSGRDRKKDYSHIRALLNDALTGFANKAGPLKVERKSRGGLVLTHTTNFPCLRQSTPDNGMDAWYAILQMQEYIKYADDMLLPENLRNRFANMADVPDREIRKNWGRIQQFICTIILQDVNNRSGEFFYGYGLPPNDEIDLRLEMSRDERPFNSLEGCRPFPPRRTT